MAEEQVLANPPWKLLEEAKVFQDLAGRCFQEDYQGQLGFSNMGQLLRLAKRAGLERDKQGLNLFCGNGRPGLFIIRRNRCKLVGLAADRDGLEVGQERAERYGLNDSARFVQATGWQGLPFDNAVFDGVITADGFSGGGFPTWFIRTEADLEALYLEVKRVLKPGGGFAFYSVKEIASFPPALSATGVAPAANALAADPAFLLQKAGFETISTANVTGEIHALLNRTRQAFEERGVLERLRDALGPLADALYQRAKHWQARVAQQEVQRWFYSAQKPQ